MARKQQDFFGDDDFLLDFDVDAAIRSSGLSSKPSLLKSGSTVSRDPSWNTKQGNDDFPGLNLDTNKVSQDLSSSSSNRIPSTKQENDNQGSARHDSFPGLDLDTNIETTPAGVPSASKRARVTPTTQTTQNGDTPVAFKSPFPPNSKFSLGNKSDTSVLASVHPVTSPETSFPTSDSMTTTAADYTATQDNDVLTRELTSTMEKYFGFDSFRPGQLPVLQSLLKQKDAAVFWATGTGKSLCYQIPPLHTNQVGLVVSPLISLMQDQVNKLNGLSNQRLATYLGSSQMDSNEEVKALNGEYPLVYVTPEKLLSEGFLDRLAHMHRSKKRLCLVAIDESHCVSEWGHDFRPEYRNLGRELRGHLVLQQVPIVALTATAVPRVQRDICDSLKLRDPHLARQSFDRTNLDISIHKKDQRGGGFRAALESVIKEIQQSPSSSMQSTIIYAPSRDLVEDIASYLQQELGNDAVQPYHGKMDHQARTEAHLNFLVGRTKVIVATVAFGMGIDKPDTRRVLHFGPPKTVEEYYQQIGRAGRDGLPAECVMYVSDGDFVKYKSDFYLASVPEKARVALEGSMDALRNYALDTVTCRRKALLDFFQEKSPFGERCGACDTCRNHAKYGPDSERDFGNEGARVILAAVRALNGQSMGIIEKVVSGHQVESYRYRCGHNATNTSGTIKEMRQAMSKKRPMSHFKELMAPLVAKGYLSQATKKTNIDGFSVSLVLFCKLNPGFY